RVTGLRDVRWPDTSAKNVRSPIRVGEALKIDSGWLEIELNRGVKLSIEGPATWSIHDDNRATLSAGKLLARVPSQAVGFTIETPTAKIIDLGTEFGVQVDNHGTTDVQVFKGEIELQTNQPSSGKQNAKPVKLHAGNARRVEITAQGGRAIREISP